MNIFNRSQIKAWDDFTIKNEPIAAIDLMERASSKVSDWLMQRFTNGESFVFFCGIGNNGGDGMGVARMLIEKEINVKVFLFKQGELSEDAQKNLERLIKLSHKVLIFSEVSELDTFDKQDIIIDALFGTGLSRPLENASAELVDYINTLPNRVVSIDLPSGLPADTLAANLHVVKADYTLTFHYPKFSFFLPEHGKYIGQWFILDIGLHTAFELNTFTPYQYCDEQFIKLLLPPSRDTFSHKGNYGHAVLSGGSKGMMGALILALQACLKSGVGLVTALPPDEQLYLVQLAVPEAMCGTSEHKMQHQWYHKKTAVGVGMGWCEDDYHGKLLQWLICNMPAPLLIDASALNLLSSNLDWLHLRPKNSFTILTPHPGEFARLSGVTKNSIEQLEKAKEIASNYNVIIILKGAFTRIITPKGLVYFNSTGNAGMAKGGSGDVLSGLVTGMLAQGMAPVSACLLGVYLHGLAGDLAASEKTVSAMTSYDVIQQLPNAWKRLTSINAP